MRPWTLALIFLTGVLPAYGETTIRSAPGGTSLLELYSSEGCSSCPPADEWVSNLRTHPDLWRTFVPVIFHVDYWDHLGWKDPLARAAFSQRQRDYAGFWGNDSVYTPGFVLNAIEWRRPRKFLTVPRPESAGGELEIVSQSLTRHHIRYHPARPGTWRVHAALLGMDLRSQVAAGENRGRRLRHDFVVLDYIEFPMKSEEADFDLSPVPTAHPARYALAAWITREDNPIPVQTAGGYLPGLEKKSLPIP